MIRNLFNVAPPLCLRKENIGRNLFLMKTDQYKIFIGSYGSTDQETIHWLNWKEGHWEKLAAVSGVENPSFLSFNHSQSHLFSVSEVEKGELISYKLDHDERRMKEMNRQSTNGWAPCYVENLKDQYLFTANYGGGNIIVHPVAQDGKIMPFCAEFDFSDIANEKGLTSHPHTIRQIPSTDRYMVADLGLNCLFIYEFNPIEGKLDLIEEIEAPEGSGPRHIAFHPSLNIVYVVNELNSSILTYSYQDKGENFKLLQNIATIPSDWEGANYCADIHITPSGSFLFVSNRGHHSIASYFVSNNGLLEVYAYTNCKGEWPRNFAISPDEKYIFVANEHTHNIVTFQLEGNGDLLEIGNPYSLHRPVCIKIQEI